MKFNGLQLFALLSAACAIPIFPRAHSINPREEDMDDENGSGGTAKGTTPGFVTSNVGLGIGGAASAASALGATIGVAGSDPNNASGGGSGHGSSCREGESTTVSGSSDHAPT